jgi:hypothetical protein
MLELYFRPMACSLASRIALTEAGIEARYHSVNLRTKKIRDSNGDFWAVAPKGTVPVLVLEDGQTLMETRRSCNTSPTFARILGLHRSRRTPIATACRSG